MALWNAVGRAIAAATGRPFRIGQLAPLQGGRVGSAYLVADGATRYFVKTQNEALAPAFAWEARSLREIAAAGVPAAAVVATGTHGTRSFLVLEYVEPAAPPSAQAIAAALIDLHASTAATYGAEATGCVALDRLHATGGAGACCEMLDNTPAESWADFWCERRLRPRLARCAATPAWAAARPRIEALLPVMHEGLAAHRPRPALLHGDLNNLNWLGRADGSAVFIDPTFWYGDPEVDLAALDGGPPAGRAALAEYLRVSPRPPGFEWRLAVYRLWYLLSCFPVAADALLVPTLDRIERGPPT